MNLQQEDFSTLLLIAFTLFLIVREYSSFHRDKKKIESFGEPSEKFELVKRKVYEKLVLIIVIFIGIANIVNLGKVIDLIYVVIFMSFVVLLWYKASRKVLVFNQGLYLNSRFVTWQNIKSIKRVKNKIVLNTELNDKARLVNRDIEEVQTLWEVIEHHLNE